MARSARNLDKLKVDRRTERCCSVPFVAVVAERGGLEASGRSVRSVQKMKWYLCADLSIRLEDIEDSTAYPLMRRCCCLGPPLSKPLMTAISTVALPAKQTPLGASTYYMQTKSEAYTCENQSHTSRQFVQSDRLPLLRSSHQARDTPEDHRVIRPRGLATRLLCRCLPVFTHWLSSPSACVSIDGCTGRNDSRDGAYVHYRRREKMLRLVRPVGLLLGCVARLLRRL